MSTRKIIIDENIIKNYLKNNFDNDSKVIKEFSGNEVSRAFLFSAKNKEYVIRVDSNIDTFKKDKYAFDHFSTSKLIIPKTIRLGNIEEEIFYSITEKLEGTPLGELGDFAFKKALPDIALTLKIIHDTNISSTKGYGDWGLDGEGKYKSWKDYLLSLRSSNYYNWDKMFSEGKYEKELFEKAHNKMLSLLGFISEERNLLHGDFGFSNVLIKNDKVSGVLDWGISKFGDFVYDIAWLDYWSEKTDYGEFLRNYYKDKNLVDYNKRLTCYKCHIGLTSSGFFAKYDDLNGYKFTKSRLLKCFN